MCELFADDGTLELIVQRPAEDMRVVLAEAELNVAEDWGQLESTGSTRTADGAPHPTCSSTS